MSDGPSWSALWPFKAAHLFELLGFGLHLLLQGGERVPELQSLFILGHHLLLDLPLLAGLKAVGVNLASEWTAGVICGSFHCTLSCNIGTIGFCYCWLEAAVGKKKSLPAQQSPSSSSPTSSAVHWCGRWCSFRQPAACSPLPDKTKWGADCFFKMKNVTFLY